MLRPGESMLVDRHITEMEIILFRPLNPTPISPRRSLKPQPKSAKRGASRGAKGPSGSAGRKHTGAQQATPDLDPDAGGDSPRSLPRLITVSSTPAPAHSAENQAPERPPLFFDTTACVFYSDINRTDYVATGRATTDTKGVRHKPHAVVTGNESVANGYSHYNVDHEGFCVDCRSSTGANSGTVCPICGATHHHADDASQQRGASGAAAVNSGVVMAAGDGIQIFFRKLSLCSGILVNASLFTKEFSLDTVKNLYYMVRRMDSTAPMCLVPITVPDSRFYSSTAVMLRRVKLLGELVWELSNVNEPLIHTDVTSVISSLEKRGLHDPPNYDKRCGEGADNDRRTADSFVGNDDDEESEESDTDSTTSGAKEPKEFAELLANVPVVTREGRRQYNVGHPHARGAISGDDVGTDEDDEILDDALRAAVPKYSNSCLVRYDDGAYNVGSRSEALASHYSDHREGYALESAAEALAMPKHTPLPSRSTKSSRLAGRDGADSDPSAARLDRCHVEETEGQRLPLPPEFMVSAPPDKDQRRTAGNGHQRRGLSGSRRGSSASKRRSRSSRKGRKGSSRRGGRKRSSRKGRKRSSRKGHKRSSSKGSTRGDSAKEERKVPLSGDAAVETNVSGETQQQGTDSASGEGNAKLSVLAVERRESNPVEAAAATPIAA